MISGEVDYTISLPDYGQDDRSYYCTIDPCDKIVRLRTLGVVGFVTALIVLVTLGRISGVPIATTIKLHNSQPRGQ